MNKNTTRNVLFILISFVGIVLALAINLYPQRVERQYNIIEVPGETIEKYIYEQPRTQPNLDKNTVILLDKSGSMKEYISEIYLRNFEYFSEFDCWSFDKEVYTEFQLEKITFEGDTDVIKAIRYAAASGYKNIVVFSDMEQSIKKSYNSEFEWEVNIIIYSPHEFTEKACIDYFMKQDSIKSIKQFVISGLFENDGAGLWSGPAFLYKNFESLLIFLYF